MRTVIVFSIIAAVPVTANAAASGYVAESNLLITGSTVQSIKLGKIANGQYHLISQPIAISSDNALKVQVYVGGAKFTEQILNSTNNRLDLVFSANGYVDVEFRFLNLVSTYEVRIEGVSADLTLDFEALAGDLQTQYNHLENEFNFYTFDNVDYWQGRKGEIQTKILQIKKIADEEIVGTEAFEVYNDLDLGSLWSISTGWSWDTETSLIFDEIAKLRSDMKDYEIVVLTQSGNDFEQAEADYNALPDYDKKDDKGNDTELTEKYKLAKNGYALLSGTPTFEQIKAYVEALQNLVEAIDAAETALDDNNAAAAIMLADAEKYYNETVDYFQELMPEYTTRHNDLYENALQDIQPLKDAIKTISDAQANGTAAANATALQKAIDDAKANIPATINGYKALVPKLIAALDVLDAQAELVKATMESKITNHNWIVAVEAFEEVMYKDYADLDPQKTALQQALDNLEDFIEDNDTKDNLDNLADLSAYTKAIADADKAMKDKATNYQDYDDLIQTIVLLELQAYNDINEVKHYAYNATDDPDNPGKGLSAAEYDVEDLWLAGTDNIIGQYPAIITAIEANKEDIAAWKSDNQGWTFKDQYTTPFNRVFVDIVNLKANSMSAIDIYADNKANLKAINDLIAYLKAEVELKGLDIWNEEVIGNEYTPYSKKIEEIKKKGLEIQGYLTESLNHKSKWEPKTDKGEYDEDCHLGYLLKYIPDGKDALTDDVAAHENMKENIEEYEQAYKDQCEAQAIQDIKDNILALVNDYTDDISDELLNDPSDPDSGLFNFDPIQDKVDEALSAIRDKMAAALEVAQGDSNDKDALTAVYEDLKAANEDVLIEGKTVNILQDALDKIKDYKNNVTALNDIIDPLVNFDWNAMAEAIKVADENDTFFTTQLQGYKDNQVPALIAKIKGREDPAEWSTHETRYADRTEVIALVNEIFDLDDQAYYNGVAWKAALNKYGIAMDHEYTDVEPFYGYNQAMVKIEEYPSSELENLKAALNAFKDQIDELKAAAKENHAKGTATNADHLAIEDALAEMNVNMKTWINDGVAAFMLDDAKKYYNETVDYFQELMPEYTSRHKNLYENALQDIQTLQDVIDAVEDAKTEGTAKDNQVKLQENIDAAKATINATIDTYKNLAAMLIAALDIYDAQAALVKETEESKITTANWLPAPDEVFEEEMYKDYGYLATEVSNLDTKLADLLAFIAANDTKDKVADLADLSDYTNAVTDANKALKDKADNYQAYEDLKIDVKKLELQVTADFSALKAYAYDAPDEGKGLDGTDYKLDELWATGIANVADQFPGIIAKIEAGKEDIAAWKKADDGNIFEAEYTAPLAKATKDATDLKNNAKTAIDIYAENLGNLKAINDLTDYLTAEVKDKGLEIWEEKVEGNENTPYGRIIHEIKNTASKIQDALAESLKAAHITNWEPKTDSGENNPENHLGYLNEFAPAGSLANEVATLEDMKENFEKYEQDYKDQRNAQDIKDLKDNILALVNDYTDDISDELLNDPSDPDSGLFDFDPIQDKVDEALSAIRDKMAAALEVAQGDSDDKDALTAVYEDLNAANEDVLIEGKTVNILQDALAQIDTYKKNVNSLNTTIAPLADFDFDAMAESIKAADGDDTFFTAQLQDYKENKAPALIAKIKGREDPAEWTTHATEDADRAEVLALVDEINMLDDLAYENGQAWEKAQDAYALAVDHEYTDAEPFYGYNQAMVKIEEYPSSELENLKAALNAFKDQIDELKAAAEENHAKGTATNADQLAIEDALAEMNAKMKTWISDITTDIKETITNDLDTVGHKIYNLNGKLMNSLQKGMNILRDKDGKSKKVVVK